MSSNAAGTPPSRAPGSGTAGTASLLWSPACMSTRSVGGGKNSPTPWTAAPPTGCGCPAAGGLRSKKSPEIIPALLSIVGPLTGGDPMGQTKFVRPSLQALSKRLAELGHAACPTTVARLLRTQAYSPRVNVKRFTGPDHPDRDLQFQNIQEWVDIFTELGLPIISVDGKKKELIGNFKNTGAVWCDEPEEVNVYDFIADAECRATPYGIYDLLSGRGHICVGTSADTPAFAVESIRRWWARYGCKRYPRAD